MKKNREKAKNTALCSSALVTILDFYLIRKVSVSHGWQFFLKIAEKYTRNKQRKQHKNN
jgi:hypothetical protein